MIDILYAKYQWLNQFSVNDYKLLTVFWNIFLAFIPAVIVAYINDYWDNIKFIKLYHKFFVIVLMFVWLIFAPNSIYIITDIRHLLDYCPIDSPKRVCVVNAWMIPWFFLYASLGWIFFVYLLRQMSNLIKKIFNQTIAKLIIIAAMPFISLGVLLGLINRWNSWDIFFNPLQIINSGLVYFQDFRYFNNWLSFTVCLYILYFLGKNLFIKSVVESHIWSKFSNFCKFFQKLFR